MKRRYTVEQALEKILEPVEEAHPEASSPYSSSPEDCSDTEWEVSMQPESPYSSASTEVSEEGDKTAWAEWTSKNGQVSWLASNEESLRYSPTKCLKPGPTRYAINRITEQVKSCWDLYITDDIIQLIIQMTNLQGRHSEAWIDVDRIELEAFFGLLILAGVYRSRDESTRSLWCNQSGRAIFSATMSRNRFEQLASKLQFDDPLTRPERQRRNRLAAISTLWEKWEHQLSLLFNPARDITVDEQLVAFRGRCKFKQYIPSKPARYGIKVWVVCDARSSYALKMQVYTGKQEGQPSEVNQGKRVVLELTEGLAGHTVTCDNFFTSYALGEELLKRKMGLIGTIRRNKPELPQILLNMRKRAILSSLFAFTKTHTAVSYIPKRGKNVMLLSTVHREPAISDKAHKKPKIILDYNSSKGGVDNLDKCVGTYSCHRKTCRWPMVLFYNILDVSAFNSFVLWMAVDPTWKKGKLYKRRLFLEELGVALVTPQMQQRQRIPRTPNAAARVAEARRLQQGREASTSAPEDHSRTPKRGLCVKCIDQPKRRKASNACCNCGKHICKAHSYLYCSSCC